MESSSKVDAEWLLGDDQPVGDHVLLQKKIVNGVITSDVLDAIYKVSTNLELNELLSL